VLRPDPLPLFSMVDRKEKEEEEGGRFANRALGNFEIVHINLFQFKIVISFVF
jgi:hypothetical protein